MKFATSSSLSSSDSSISLMLIGGLGKSSVLALRAFIFAVAGRVSISAAKLFIADGRGSLMGSLSALSRARNS